MDTNLDRLQQMFQRMLADGFDTSQPLRWGYFFVHSVRQPLDELAGALIEVGYTPVSIHQADDGDWVLQVFKDEIHSPESLHRRNGKFNDLVRDWSIDLYDGWDVEKIAA